MGLKHEYSGDIMHSRESIFVVSKYGNASVVSGAPSRVAVLFVIGWMLGATALNLDSTSSEAVDSLLKVRSSHFAVFNSRPNCGERRRMVLKSAKTSSAVPPSVPSSRYIPHIWR